MRWCSMPRSCPGRRRSASAAPRIGALSMRIGDPHAAAYWYEKAIAESGSVGARCSTVWPRPSSIAATTVRAGELVEEGLALEPAHDGLRALARTLGVR